MPTRGRSPTLKLLNESARGEGSTTASLRACLVALGDHRAALAEEHENIKSRMQQTNLDLKRSSHLSFQNQASTLSKVSARPQQDAHEVWSSSWPSDNADAPFCTTENDESVRLTIRSPVKIYPTETGPQRLLSDSRSVDSTDTTIPADAWQQRVVLYTMEDIVTRLLSTARNVDSTGTMVPAHDTQVMLDTRAEDVVRLVSHARSVDSKRTMTKCDTMPPQKVAIQGTGLADIARCANRLLSNALSNAAPGPDARPPDATLNPDTRLTSAGPSRETSAGSSSEDEQAVVADTSTAEFREYAENEDQKTRQLRTVGATLEDHRFALADASDVFKQDFEPSRSQPDKAVHDLCTPHLASFLTVETSTPANQIDAKTQQGASDTADVPESYYHSMQTSEKPNQIESLNWIGSIPRHDSTKMGVVQDEPESDLKTKLLTLLPLTEAVLAVAPRLEQVGMSKPDSTPQALLTDASQFHQHSHCRGSASPGNLQACRGSTSLQRLRAIQTQRGVPTMRWLAKSLAEAHTTSHWKRSQLKEAVPEWIPEI